MVLNLNEVGKVLIYIKLNEVINHNKKHKETSTHSYPSAGQILYQFAWLNHVWKTALGKAIDSSQKVVSDYWFLMKSESQ